MLISQFSFKCCLFNRKYSRMRRLIRFLRAALPTFLVTVMPSLGRSYRPGAKKAIRQSFCNLRPDLVSSRNSDRFKIRSSFLKEKRIGTYFSIMAVLTCESSPTFCSPSINDSATRFWRHPFAKSMVSGPSDSAGLKSTLHFLSPLNNYILYRSRYLIPIDIAGFWHGKSEIFDINHKPEFMSR